MKKLLSLAIILSSILMCVGCGGETKSTIPSYKVIYNANEATSGSVPTDKTSYAAGETVTVFNNIDLKKNYNEFVCWNTKSDGTGTDYKAGDNFNITSANVTLYAKWNAIGVTGPAGGKIFYDKGTYSDGWRYLEVVPSSNYLGNTEWHAPTDHIYKFFGTSIEIGTGKANTDLIKNISPAARSCANYTLNGYDDWFLPSIKELELIQTVLKGYIPNDRHAYWSSSEKDITMVYFCDFSGNSMEIMGKINKCRLLPIRSF